MKKYLIEPWMLIVIYESQDDYLSGHKDLVKDGWEIINERINPPYIEYDAEPPITVRTRHCEYVFTKSPTYEST